MTTKQQIYRNIHDFIIIATGLDDASVRPAYVNAPAHPAQDRGLLCSVNIINQAPIGQDYKDYVDQITPLHILIGATDYVYNGLFNAKPSWKIGTATISWAAGTWTNSNGLTGPALETYTVAGTDWLPPKTGWSGTPTPPTLVYFLDLDETVYGDRNVTASIKTYGTTADDISEKIVLALTSSIGLSHLNKNGLGYLRHGPILDISTLANGNFENRRQLSVEFHVVSSNTNSVNAIESSAIGYRYFGGSEETETGTIEVNHES